MSRHHLWPLLIIVSIVLLGASCSRSTNTTTNTNVTITPTTTRGLSFSPSAITGDGVADFFTKAAAGGSFVSWAGPMSDLEKTGSGAQLVIAQAQSHQLVPVIITSPTAADLQDDTAWKLWSDNVVIFAKHSSVAYLGVGNELNKTMTTSQLNVFTSNWPNFVQAVHDVSPQTKVFTIFQLEWMKGLRGGLFGGTNDATKAQWDLLHQVASSDLVAFSTYPGLIYKNPADVPDDYYSSIAAQTSVPIALTEVGWFRTGPAGWSSSASEQADFVHRFFTLTKAVNPVFTIWSFLYDPAAAVPFDTMGFLSKDQSTSAAWKAWQQGE